MLPNTVLLRALKPKNSKSVFLVQDSQDIIFIEKGCHVENPDVREFGNDSLHVLMKEKPGCLVRLDVSVTANEVAQAYEAAHKSIKKEISYPGFRKGKAPDEVIRNKFRDIVDREARNILRTKAFQEAIKLVGRAPFGEQSVRKADLKRASMEEGAQLVFEYEAHPIVPAITVAGIQIKGVEPKPVDQEQADKVFRRILENHATFQPAANRPIADGDFVKVDIDVIDAPARNLVSDKRVAVRRGECADWLYDTLIGMKAEETKEANAPEEKEDGEKADRQVRVYVREVLDCILPQETPEVLKEVNAESFAALKERLLARIQLEEKEAAQEDMRRQLRNELIRRYAFDLPQSLVQAETQARFNQLKSKNEAELPLDKDKTDDLRKDVLEEVKRYFTCMFLLQKAAQAHHFEISQEEYFKEMTHQLFYTPAEKRVILSDQADMSRQRIYMNIMMQKVEDWLLEQALSGAHSLAVQADHDDHTSCSCPHH